MTEIYFNDAASLKPGRRVMLGSKGHYYGDEDVSHYGEAKPGDVGTVLEEVTAESQNVFVKWDKERDTPLRSVVAAHCLTPVKYEQGTRVRTTMEQAYRDGSGIIRYTGPGAPIGATGTVAYYDFCGDAVITWDDGSGYSMYMIPEGIEEIPEGEDPHPQTLKPEEPEQEEPEEESAEDLIRRAADLLNEVNVYEYSANDLMQVARFIGADRESLVLR